MPAQNNTGRQYDKTHGVTIVAQVPLADARFVAFDGGYPTNAGGAKAVQGVSEAAALANEAVNLVTDYSALVEAGGAIAFGQLVKSDGVGRAIAGTLLDHCARALGGATAAGQLVEVQLLQHTHP